MHDMTAKNIHDHGLEMATGRWYGNYRGICVDNKDPKGLHRIKVRVPHVAGDDPLPYWAYQSTPGAGAGSGLILTPAINDPVTVWFEMGDPQFANYSGGWFGEPNGESDVPSAFRADPGTAPTRGGIGFKNGMMLLFDEKPGEELVQLVWSDGTGDDAKKAVINMDKNGSIGLISKSGRRFQLDEENKQLFFSDVDEDGNVINTLAAGLASGWVMSTAGGGAVGAALSLDPSKKAVYAQGQEEVNISAPAISLEGSVAAGGSKAIYSMVVGEPLVQLLTQLITQIAAITVNTGVGISTPPNNLAAITALTAQLQGILSKTHKVGQ